MEHSPYKYIVLYDGCETADVRHCDDLPSAQTEMANMAERLCVVGVADKPYIMVFRRNEDGDYELTEVFGRDDTKQ